MGGRKRSGGARGTSVVRQTDCPPRSVGALRRNLSTAAAGTGSYAALWSDQKLVLLMACTHAAAVLTVIGAVLQQVMVSADPAGYRRLLSLVALSGEATAEHSPRCTPW